MPIHSSPNQPAQGLEHQSKERKSEVGHHEDNSPKLADMEGMASPRREISQPWLSGLKGERGSNKALTERSEERNVLPTPNGDLHSKLNSTVHEKSSLESVQTEYDESNSPPMSFSKNGTSKDFKTKHHVRIGREITSSPMQSNDSLGMISRIYNNNYSPNSSNEFHDEEKPQKRLFLGRSYSSSTQYDKPTAPPSSSPSFNQQRQTKTSSSTTTNSSTNLSGSPLRFDSYLSSSVKLVKQMMEKYSLNELAAQRVDESCFIANLVKGGARSPSMNENKGEEYSNHSRSNPQPSPRQYSFHNNNRMASPRTERDVLSYVHKQQKSTPVQARANESPKRSNQTPPEKNRSQSLLEKHKLQVEELDFLNESSSSSSDDEYNNHDEENSSKLPDPTKNPREYYEFMLAQALAKKNEKKDPTSNEYEKMADLTFEESLSTLKKTLDSAEKLKEESLTSHTQRRRVYDSLKRGLGARPFGGQVSEVDVTLSSPRSPRSPLAQQEQQTSPNTSNTSIQSSPQPAFKFENDSNSTDTKPRKKDSALEVFQRLYTIKKPPEEEVDVPKSPRSSTRSSSPANDSFINRMKLCEEERQQRLEDLRSKFNDSLKKDISFSPKINENSKSMQRSVESLLNWQKEKITRQEQLIKNKKEKEISNECTFSPELSPRSQKLVKKKGSIPIALREY
ncbi:hypothetical protein FDP41_006323 [Naegleria fowleri]|uniref:Uncharacterized protein n=1 Tax=Naegleria fowleri TaxID=5763 RepID=A0A6A5BPK0_NAEFO|nr:uncharacterized protein FDP41_006323 [Naegleria fowleri]KAF0974849.1 hypothetical protein FDP41_006323 [Naegleria fowleri]